MTVIFRIAIGAVTGWLTGKLVEMEERSKLAAEGHVLDVISGIVGGIAGEYLYFWIVIGEGDRFSDFATSVLGSITIVGVARWFAARCHFARSYRNNPLPGSLGRVNPEKVDRSEAVAAP